MNSLTRTSGIYKPVEGLRRGLAILHALSLSSGGWATITSLSQATGLHRTTVRRMMETLQSEGYVRRSLSDDSYRLNQKVRQLGDGFTDDEWVSQVANPVLGQLLQKVVWPSDLCTLDGDTMIVRETTHRFSPLSFHRGMIRQHMPVLFTAAGRAYLAACGEQEREEVLQVLSAGNDEQARFARQRNLVQQLVERTRAQGYASNDGDWVAQSKVSALALPIMHRGKVLGSINMIFIKKVLPPLEAAQRHLPALREAIAQIESELDARNIE